MAIIHYKGKEIFNSKDTPFSVLIDMNKSNCGRIVPKIIVVEDMLFNNCEELTMSLNNNDEKLTWENMKIKKHDIFHAKGLSAIKKTKQAILIKDCIKSNKLIKT